MGTLTIDNRSYSFEDIRQGKFAEDDHYFTHALKFCRLWLNGSKEFELQTSGSTGLPKNILVNRSQMEVSAKATKRFFKISKNPILLCCLNTWFIAGKMMLVRGMEWNADICLVKPSLNPFSSPSLVLPYDLVAMVPLQVESCFTDELGLQGLKHLKQLIIGGASSSPGIIEKLIQENIPAHQTYGMTETVSHIALAPITNSSLIYEVLEGVKIGVDERQCLWLEAPMAKESRLQTNDIITLVSSTSFIWQGRADFTINTGGIKVQPEQVEKTIKNLLSEFYGNVRFFIGGLADEQYGQKVVLLVELSESIVNKEEMLKKLADILPKYHQPKEIYYLPEFITTESGKINRPLTLNLLCSSS